MPGRIGKELLVGGLAVLGIVPFCLAAAWPDPALGRIAFALYSLAIFCFLCGVWWATALVAADLSEQQRSGGIVLSNVLVILACLLQAPIFLYDATAALLGMALLFAVLLLGERRLPVFAGQPLYYRHTRVGVTSAVIALHIVAVIVFP